MAEELVFMNLRGIYVSNTRVVLNNATYATANITSVKLETKPANLGCGAILVAFGALCAFCTYNAHWEKNKELALKIGGFLALPALLIGILWFFLDRAKYTVVVCSAAGEQHALVHTDRKLVGAVIRAITDAIVSRG